MDTRIQAIEERVAQLEHREHTFIANMQGLIDANKIQAEALLKITTAVQTLTSRVGIVEHARLTEGE